MGFLLSNVFAGEGNGTLLQYSCLENPMDGGAWWAAVHGVEKSQTRLSDFNFTFTFYGLGCSSACGILAPDQDRTCVPCITRQVL